MPSDQTKAGWFISQISAQISKKHDIAIEKCIEENPIIHTRSQAIRLIIMESKYYKLEEK